MHKNSPVDEAGYHSYVPPKESSLGAARGLTPLNGKRVVLESKMA